MSRIKIIGGHPLKGEIVISGAKNSALPIMAASLLTNQSLVIKNVPLLRDTSTMSSLLKSLGAEVKRDANIVSIDTHAVEHTVADIDIVSKMRGSFLVLGPLLARFKKAKVGLPGGCLIGARLIDYHLRALAKMGALIFVKNGYVEAHVDQRLKGCEIFLPTPSVGATENIMMAATLAEGDTVINNAAIEPEVTDLSNCLHAMGANITGIGTNKLVVRGVKELYACEYNIIPDRIEAATYAIAAAITDGYVVINNLNVLHLYNFIEKLRIIGVYVKVLSESSIEVSGSLQNMKWANITTGFYPDIATDLQSLLVVLLSLASGQSVVTETVFNNRFGHVEGLQLMGANITITSNVACIVGVKSLQGARVRATDLRAGAALVLAGLAANGETVVEEIHHMERGYESLETKLSLCGAEIERVTE